MRHSASPAFFMRGRRLAAPAIYPSRAATRPISSGWVSAARSAPAVRAGYHRRDGGRHNAEEPADRRHRPEIGVRAAWAAMMNWLLSPNSRMNRPKERGEERWRLPPCQRIDLSPPHQHACACEDIGQARKQLERSLADPGVDDRAARCRNRAIEQSRSSKPSQHRAILMITQRQSRRQICVRSPISARNTDRKVERSASMRAGVAQTP